MNWQLGLVVLVLLLSGCSRNARPPDWQLQAKEAMDASVSTYLLGDSRTSAREFERARRLIASTGRIELVARAELIRCSAQVASLDFEPCDGFEHLRVYADPPERAYADYLAGRALRREEIERLPPAQRRIAAAIAGEGKPASAIEAISDPLSRLVAAAVLFRAGMAEPGLMAVAADAASAQGWRRPLVAWLEVQALRAESAGMPDEAERLRARIDLIKN